MSELTLQDLLAFDAGPWQAVSTGWRRLAEGIDDTDEQLTRGTRDLPEAWRSGTGAQAATDKATTLCNRVREAYSPVKNIGDQLDLHGYAMAGLRQQAEQIIAQARQAGYTVDTASMSITAPASAYMGGNLDRTGRETGALLNDLRAVVERARAQDAETARVLTGNVPSGPAGAGPAQAGAITRAEELALKIKDPTYEPTPAELAELRTLLQTYGKDKIFAFELLNTLGPKGLLELNGTLATYQLDHPGKDTDSVLFNNNTADLVRDLQNSLGVMLDTATEPTGAKSGLRGETYVPGQYELSSQWVSDLMAAGRSRMDIGDPYSPARYVEGVYGYQLLAPMLRNGDLDPAFVATVGGDIVDFEREQGKNSALWNEGRGENVRLDWTQDHNADGAPAGYDPVASLMDGLSRNGAAGQELFAGVSESSTDPKAPPGGRLPRLDYLLTDRNWEADVPGGPGWTAEVMEHGDDYRKSGLNDLGIALERATIDHQSEQARHIVEAIVYETGVDEQATGAENGKDPQKASAADFMKTDVINPEMRDSMANIMSSYIVDVNANISDAKYPGADYAVMDRDHLVRFLADLGKDEASHEQMARAEAAYGTAAYDHILSGRQNPDADMRGHLEAMKVVSQNYGSVMGALDLGAVEAKIETSAEADEKHNAGVETRYKVIGPIVEGLVGAATSRIPGGSDLANGFVGTALEDLEKWEKADSSGLARYQVGETLSAGRTSAVDIIEATMYSSGTLEKLPPNLMDGNGGLKPMDKWSNEDISTWREYKGSFGMETVGAATNNAGNSYQLGYDWAQTTLTPDVQKNGEK
jgi:hypothetical protein